MSPIELTGAQLLIVGFIATLIVQGLRLAIAKWGQTIINKRVVSIICFVISTALAYIFLKPAIPTTHEPIELAVQLLSLAAGVMGFATLIYNLLLEKILSSLGWTVQKAKASGGPIAEVV